MYTYGIKIMINRDRGYILMGIVDSLEEAKYYLRLYQKIYAPIEIYYYIYEENA